MSESDPTAVFVYGTLMQDRERAACWPTAPLSIEPAWTSGRLFDLGPYPALLAGRNKVAGEVWSLQPEAVAETLTVLDRIECTGQGGVDLYHRRVVPCTLLAAEHALQASEARILRAFAYFFADERRLHAATEVAPGPDGYCRWQPGVGNCT